MNQTQLKSRVQALLATQLGADEVYQLLKEVIAVGGGVTLDLDDQRFRLVQRDGVFGLKRVEHRRSSTLPPVR